MPFEKGKSGNPSGRQKGSLNKTTENIRNTIAEIVIRSIGTIENDLNELEPKDRIKALTDLAKFVLPTLRAIEYGNILDRLSTDDLKEIINQLKSQNES